MKFLSKICSISTIIIIYCLVIITEIDGHGRLIDPASRSSAWRFGFKTEINYNDNQLFCGGFNTQWNINKGKCGVCGDPYNGRRDNEVPNGRYAKQLVITRTYRSGDIIDVKIQITANHMGFFEFGLCPALSKTVEVSQQCLDKYRPRVLNSQTSDKYIVPTNRAETYRIRLKLPDGLVCDRCVFQWSYTAGNNWGVCANGTGAVGCGPQETFRGCADVRIVAGGPHSVDAYNTPVRSTLSSLPPIPSRPPTRLSYYVPDWISSSSTTPLITPTKTTSSAIIIITKPENTKQNQTLYSSTKEYPKVLPTTTTDSKSSIQTAICSATGIWTRVPNMDDWCLTNCAANYCPPTHCKCV